MGTYISLTLKDRSEKNNIAVNALWDNENPGYENTFHINTRADIKADIEYIKKNPGQEHLRYIKSVDQWNKTFPLWGSGQFQTKITLGDHLCSEMARRYIAFLEKHGDLFKEFPSEHVMEILHESASEDHIAEDCGVDCMKCKAAKSEPAKLISDPGRVQ